MSHILKWHSVERVAGKCHKLTGLKCRHWAGTCLTPALIPSHKNMYVSKTQVKEQMIWRALFSYYRAQTPEEHYKNFHLTIWKGTFFKCLFQMNTRIENFQLEDLMCCMYFSVCWWCLLWLAHWRWYMYYCMHVLMVHITVDMLLGTAWTNFLGQMSSKGLILFIWV